MTKKEGVNLALMNKGLLMVLSGPSGSGKDTVLAELKSKSANLKQSISMTTRPMREGEVDGIDYYFTDVKTFEENIEKGYFLEYVKYGDNYYGTPKNKIEELLNEGVNVILKIEVEGGMNIRNSFPETVSVFITPPSIEVLKQRLKGRGTESEETYSKRLKIAEDELLRAKEYDYVVINDELSECVATVESIIISENCRYEKMKDFVEKINNN